MTDSTTTPTIDHLRWRHVAGESLTRAEIDRLFAAIGDPEPLPPGADAGVRLYILGAADTAEATLTQLRDQLAQAKRQRDEGKAGPNLYHRRLEEMVRFLGGSVVELLADAYPGTRNLAHGMRLALNQSAKTLSNDPVPLEAAIDALLGALEREAKDAREAVAPIDDPDTCEAE